VCEDMGANVYVLDSQGESTLARLLDSLKRNEGLEQVPNLAYFDRGGVRMNRK